ncbi:MAG: efflux RND transporter periplasmic adaptor subunit [Firmicutes bacterium]|nr:efflux RND transporter periplasmic adaptor subunit [Bacillota bacterium]MCL5038652.1 efflux RND transporter periplasmic adaptor subunit [Bacillota bacterium]
MKRAKWMNRIVVVIIVLGVLGGGYWTGRRYLAARSVPTANFVTDVVRKGDLTVTVSGTGTVAAAEVQDVRAGVAGTVTSVNFREGDQVKAGQVLVSLASDSVVSQVEQARLDLEQAQLRLSDLKNPSDTSVSAAQLKVQQAQLNLQSRQTDVDHLTVTAPISGKISNLPVQAGDDVMNGAILLSIIDDSQMKMVVPVPQISINRVTRGQKTSLYFEALSSSGDPYVDGVVTDIGQQGYLSGKTTVVDVTITLPNNKDLKPGWTGAATLTLSDGSILTVSGPLTPLNKQDVKARAAATVDQIAVAEGDQVTAGQILVKLKSDTLLNQLEQAKNDLQSAQINLDNLKNSATSTDVKTQGLKVQQSQLNLNLRLIDLANLSIPAPVAGLMTFRGVNIGDRIGQNAVIGTVSDLSRMNVTVPVDELDVAKVKPGQKADLTLDALPNRNFRGTVMSIAPQGVSRDGVASFNVTIEIENPQGILPGMTANASILIEKKNGVLMVPAEAVRKIGGKDSVNVLVAGVPQRREVKVGSQNTYEVEIVSGLKEGDVIVLAFTQNGSGPNIMRFGNYPAPPREPTPGTNKRSQTR